jgi:hypothetical protein
MLTSHLLNSKEMATTAVDLRNTLNDYIKTADLRLLKIMKATAEIYSNNEQEFTLSEEHYKTIDNRRESLLRGESKSVSWKEVKINARNASS